MLFSLHVFEFFPNFLLWLSSSFKALWSRNRQGMITVFWYWLRPDLWPGVWSILENIPCALEKNAYSAALGWNVLNITVRSIWSSMSFKAFVSSLIFCLDDLSIAVSGVLKSPSVIVLLSMCFFNFVINWLIKLAALMLEAWLFTIIRSSCWIDPLSMIKSASSSLITIFGLKSNLSVCLGGSLS